MGAPPSLIGIIPESYMIFFLKAWPLGLSVLLVYYGTRLSTPLQELGNEAIRWGQITPPSLSTSHHQGENHLYSISLLVYM